VLAGTGMFLPGYRTGTVFGFSLSDTCQNNGTGMMPAITNYRFKFTLVPVPYATFVYRGHLNRTKEFGTVESPSPRQAQESRDSTIDFDQFLLRSRLSCACVGEGDSTVLNSFVRLRGLKFSAPVPVPGYHF
jgi:hypothetical protein